MEMDLPGLLCERTSSGKLRWRVRPEGNKRKRIAVPPPTDPDFMLHYVEARSGYSIAKPDEVIEESLGWLVERYSVWMDEQLKHKLLDRSTVHQRKAFYDRMVASIGRDKKIEMPRSRLLEFRDTMLDTPGAADNMIKSVRALYKWAIDRDYAQTNPATNIPRINRSTGATPWSVDDLKQFRDRHPPGTMAHLAVTLFMFTACRIGDAYRLGRQNETRSEGFAWIEWKPAKTGSAPVSIPLLPPLQKSIAAQKIVGPTYLLNGHGSPFASAAAFGNWFRDRVREADLTGRSPHGIRKACGELLALHGATQYEIMAIHGHTNAKTSEIYTKDVNRKQLAQMATKRMASFDW